MLTGDLADHLAECNLLLYIYMLSMAHSFQLMPSVQLWRIR